MSMKRWENGEYIDLTAEEEAEVMERVVAREVEEQQLAKAEAEKAAAIQARQEKFAAFKAKATQGKATSADLTEIVLTLVEAQLE
mgnify:FL=1